MIGLNEVEYYQGSTKLLRVNPGQKSLPGRFDEGCIPAEQVRHLPCEIMHVGK
jgi:hypothetical protein